MKTPRKPRNNEKAARNGRSHAAERFRIAVAILRDDYDLTPEILAEIEAIAKKLENEK